MITNNDLTTQAISWAMHGLETRSQVIANNVANLEVPNFTASEVDFESQLSTAIRSGEIDHIADPVVSRTDAPAGANGNNVRLEDEMVAMLEVNLMKNAMIEAFNYKAGLMRLAVKGQ